MGFLCTQARVDQVFVIRRTGKQAGSDVTFLNYITISSRKGLYLVCGKEKLLTYRFAVCSIFSMLFACISVCCLLNLWFAVWSVSHFPQNKNIVPVICESLREVHVCHCKSFNLVVYRFDSQSIPS